MSKIASLLGAVLVCFAGFASPASSAGSKHPVRCFRAAGWYVPKKSSRKIGTAYPSRAAAVFGPAWTWATWVGPFAVVDSRNLTPAEKSVELACVGAPNVP